MLTPALWVLVNLALWWAVSNILFVLFMWWRRRRIDRLFPSLRDEVDRNLQYRK